MLDRLPTPGRSSVVWAFLRKPKRGEKRQFSLPDARTLAARRGSVEEVSAVKKATAGPVRRDRSAAPGL